MCQHDALLAARFRFNQLLLNVLELVFVPSHRVFVRELSKRLASVRLHFLWIVVHETEVSIRQLSFEGFRGCHIGSSGVGAR